MLVDPEIFFLQINVRVSFKKTHAKILRQRRVEETEKKNTKFEMHGFVGNYVWGKNERMICQKQMTIMVDAIISKKKGE